MAAHFPPSEVVVFDFDGVILESVEVKTRAFSELFAAEPERDRIVEHHVAHPGTSRYDKFRYIYAEILGRVLTDVKMQELDSQLSSLVRDDVMGCPYVAGAEMFLKRWSNHLDLFVASATPQRELEEIVAARGLAPYFKTISGSPRSKVAAIQEVLRTSRRQLAQVTFVGDALADYQAAIESGVRFIGRVRSSDRNPFPQSVEVIPDLLKLDEAVGVSGVGAVGQHQ